MGEFGYRNEDGRDNEQVTGVDWRYANFGSWVFGPSLGMLLFLWVSHQGRPALLQLGIGLEISGLLW